MRSASAHSHPIPLGFLFFIPLLFFMISLCRAETLNITFVGLPCFCISQGLRYQAEYSICSSPFQGSLLSHGWASVHPLTAVWCYIHPSLWSFHFLPAASRTAASFLARVLLNISEAKRRIPGSPVAKGFLRHPRGLASPEASTSSRDTPMDPDSCKPPASSDLGGGVHLMGMK